MATFIRADTDFILARDFDTSKLVPLIIPHDYEDTLENLRAIDDPSDPIVAIEEDLETVTKRSQSKAVHTRTLECVDDYSLAGPTIHKADGSTIISKSPFSTTSRTYSSEFVDCCTRYYVTSAGQVLNASNGVWYKGRVLVP